MTNQQNPDKKSEAANRKQNEETAHSENPKTTKASNAKLVSDLLEMIKLEKLEEDLYRGKSFDFVGQRVFGGQALAQALMAASHSVDRPAHSLHAYFLYGGDINAPIIYQVERLRDGRSLLSRQVKAIQYGRVIFCAMISFAHYEEGLNYQKQMPNHPSFSELPSEQQIKEKIQHFIPNKMRKRIMRERHVEIKPVKVRNEFAPEPMEATNAVWIRVTDKNELLPAVEDYKTHQALLAFLSDYYLLGVGTLPHGVSFWSTPNLQSATIDHSIHFHQPIDVGQWLLHDMKCDVTSNARSLNLGQFWQGDKLVVSTQQEGLLRLRETDQL